MTRIPPLAAILALLLSAVLASCHSDTSGLDDEAVIVFAFRGRPADTIRVLVRRAETVRLAERYLETERGPHIPAGRIARGAGSDARFPFHFEPESVRLVETAIELCDGVPMRSAAEVDAYFEGATGDPNAESAPWCPWSAYPVKVERR